MKTANKKKTVKGFTLIELIVVMAIFGIVMFGALQLVRPVMKMMVQADVHEGGNAAVSSISGYIENELSTAEYLTVKSTLTIDPAADVADFVDTYYEGVLKAGCTTASPAYGTGKVHVMTIDNANNGKISNYVYDVSFTPGAPAVTLVSSEEYAVNKAYYDNYSFELKPGAYSTMSEFDNKTFATTADMQSILMNLSAKETTFTIKATANRNKTDYSFLSVSSMSLINLYNRRGGPVTGLYYVVDERDDTSDPTNIVTEKYIADRGAQNLNPAFNQPILSGIKVDASSVSNAGYTFIYSYGVEIDTQP